MPWMWEIPVILYAFKNLWNSFTIKRSSFSYRFTDDATREAMKEIYHTSSYIVDPHGAVGYWIKDYLTSEKYGVFLETAHQLSF